MKRWLRETWELWCWAMFCPSRLQQRMNDWSSKNGNTNFVDILMGSSLNWRFFGQFCSLVGLFSLPLAGLLAHNSTLIGWLLLPIAFSMAYGLAVFFLSVAIHVPLIFGFLYGVENQLFQETLQTGWLEVVDVLPPFNQIGIGLCVAGGGSGLTSAVVHRLRRRRNIVTAQQIFILGTTAAAVTGSWLSTQSLLFAGLAGLSVCSFSYIARDRIQTAKDADDVASAVAGIVAIAVGCIVASGTGGIVGGIVGSGVGGIVGGIVGGFVGVVVALRVGESVGDIVGESVGVVVAVVVVVVVVFIVAVAAAVVVAVISQLPLWPFLMVAAVLAFSLSYAQQRWLGLITSAVFLALGGESLGGQVIWVLPVTLGFYYRVVPEYVLFAPIPMSQRLSLLTNIPFQNLSAKDFDRWLQRLPPYSSELLWLPLPGHAQLLAKVFQHNTTLGLDTLAKMQASSLPGFTRTVQQALPAIVADQLMQVQDVTQLQSVASEPENVAPNQVIQTILPKQFEITLTFTQAFEPSPVPTELTNIFSRLQSIAEDVTSALKSDNIALRERGLERVLNQLNLLETQLPSLGLKAKGIQRWQPVINRWQNLVELELADQQKLSKRELLNPFQYGNPLKLKQAQLFKGRQSFADNLVRLLLDRNRPTIVLHGPRRCGKTSFLNNLPRLLPSDWVPIFVDMQSAVATADEIGFLRNLARAIRRDGRSLGLKIPTEPEREAFQAAPYDTFETWLEKVLDNLGERQLLLNLDEFEKIGTAINQGKLKLTLFDELRSLIQHWEQLGFVFSGVQTLEEIGPNWSSYFISVVPVEMLYLEPNEARDLLTKPDPDFALSYAPGLVDDILKLTQCHPNLLQLIGAALVTEANEQHTTTATPTMLEAAIPRAFTLGTSYFTNVWDEFTGNIHNPAEVQAGRVILKALADDIQPAANLDSTAQSALRHMVRYHVLKQENDQYEFEIPLIQRWVCERAILDEA